MATSIFGKFFFQGGRAKEKGVYLRFTASYLVKFSSVSFNFSSNAVTSD